MTEFKQYGSKANELIRDDGLEVRGSKTWEYTVIPQNTGYATIGSFSLPFFNPADKRYHIVSTQPLEIVVHAQDTAAAKVSGKGGRQTQTLIRPLPISALSNLTSRFYGVPEGKAILLRHCLCYIFCLRVCLFCHLRLKNGVLNMIIPDSN